MPPWQIKAAVQGFISLLPGAQRINGLLQRYAPGALEATPQYLASKWRRCQTHVAHYREHATADRELVALELGTGWFPMVPVGLSLCGAAEVLTVDQQRLLSRQRVLTTLRCYLELAERGELDGALTGRLSDVERLLRTAGRRSPAALLGELGVFPLVCDARRTGLPGRSVDLLLSNNTFEHIPGNVLLDILREFRRLAAPGALCSNFIDMGDHYANFDGSLSVFNFLRFEEPVWRLLNNRLHYVNRLRLSDYRRLHSAAGWRIIDERVTRGDPKELVQIPLARRFSNMPFEELLAHEAWMVATVDDSDGRATADTGG